MSTSPLRHSRTVPGPADGFCDRGQGRDKSAVERPHLFTSSRTFLELNSVAQSCKIRCRRAGAFFGFGNLQSPSPVRRRAILLSCVFRECKVESSRWRIAHHVRAAWRQAGGGGGAATGCQEGGASARPKDDGGAPGRVPARVRGLAGVQAGRRLPGHVHVRARCAAMAFSC